VSRYKLTIEYDGTPYVGWQRQDSGPTVQAALEAAARAYCGAKVAVFCAGRTDAGVHASGQVAHVDIARGDPADTVRDAINSHLRDELITVLAASDVADGFHARFSATRRRYRYRILNRRPPPALDANRVWWVSTRLDAKSMAEATQVLLGHHDFSTFRATNCSSASPVKTLDRLDVTTDNDEIHVDVAARSFLYHQVRNFVGSLKLVGEGKWTMTDLRRALEAKDRTRGGPTAPPHGLCLTAVDYE